MASVNDVFLIGNLGKDPEVRYTPTGKTVCRFSLATTEKWGNGESQQHTEWHNIVVWGKLGELCQQYLAKGRQTHVKGAIRSRKYSDNSGVERRAYEIIASRVLFLGSGKGQVVSGDSSEGESGFDGDLPSEDDVPF